MGENARGRGADFGPYKVFERIGVGGMATVHRAKELGIEGFERWVALKRLLPHLAEDASFVRAFVREAKLASLLAHPNVVQIFELGRVGHVYFISMELIEGYDIRQILRQARKIAGPPPIPVVLALLAQICEGLEYAHTRADEDGNPLGLVHRDVSPSNVIVSHSGHVKIIDFGIAKAQAQSLQTQTGRVKGKMAYMSPESIRGHAIDHRSDLFSLGVLAHELLTARPLFATKNDYKTLQRVQNATIAPPSTFNRDCPAELDAIVLRALDRDPEERWQWAGEIRDELNALRKQPALSAQPREVVEWMRWAFALTAPHAMPTSQGDAAQSGPNRLGTVETPQPGSHPSLVLGDDLPNDPSLETPVTAPPQIPIGNVALPVAEDDDEIIEIAWGGRSSHDAIVLEEVPDVASRGSAAIPLPAAAAPTGVRSATQPGVGLTPAPTTSPGATLITHVPPPPTQRRANMPRSWATGTQPPGGLDADDDRDDNHNDDDELRFDRAPSDRAHAAAQPEQADAVPQSMPLPPSAPIVRFRDTGNARAITAPAAVEFPTTTTHPAAAPGRPNAAPVQRLRGTTTIGTSIVERGQRRFRATVVGITLLLGAGAAVAYLATRGGETSTRASVAIPTSTLKLVVEPADATVRVRATSGDAPSLHTFEASPVSTELTRGPYEVLVQREGFKPWSAAIVIATGESQSLHVVLAADDSEKSSALVLDPTQLAAPPAPARESRRRRSSAPSAPTLSRPDQAIVGEESRGTGDARGESRELRRDDNVMPLVGVEPPEPPMVPRAAPDQMVVPPTAVRKVRGAVPKLATRGDELPERISAELCMNTEGRVDRVRILTTVPDHAIKPLERALRTWRYRPYQHNGRAVRVCFAVTFRAR